MLYRRFVVLLLECGVSRFLYLSNFLQKEEDKNVHAVCLSVAVGKGGGGGGYMSNLKKV